MKRAIGILIWGWMLVVQGAVAMPVGYEFFQGGYAGGGSVSGFFRGEDLDGNGQLSSFAGEVQGFGLTFSGSAFMPGFSLDFSGLFGLVYDLDGGVLGDGTALHREGILALDWHRLFAIGPGPTWQVCDGNAICSVAAGMGGVAFSAEQMIVTAQVPEPATVLLLLIGLLGLVWARRKSRAE